MWRSFQSLWPVLSLHHHHHFILHNNSRQNVLINSNRQRHLCTFRSWNSIDDTDNTTITHKRTLQDEEEEEDHLCDPRPVKAKSVAELSYLKGPVRLNFYAKLVQNSDDNELIEKVLLQHELMKLEKGQVPARISFWAMQQILRNHVYTDQDGRRQLKELQLQCFMKSLHIRDQQKRLDKQKRWNHKVDDMKQLSRLVKSNPDQLPRNFLQVGIHFDHQGRPEYGKWKTSMFLQIKNISMKRYRPYRMVDAAIQGQRLMFDFSFFQQMNQQERVLAATLLKQAYSYNYYHLSPFDVAFTSFHRSYFDRLLRWNLPSMYDVRSFLTVRQQHFLQGDAQSGSRRSSHTKEEGEDNNNNSNNNNNNNRKLIYIVENAKDEMTHYDYQADYVLPFFADMTGTYRRVQQVHSPHLVYKRLPVEKQVLFKDMQYLYDFKVTLQILLLLKQGLSMNKAIEQGVDRNKLKDRFADCRAEDLQKIISYQKKFRTVHSQSRNGLLFVDE